MGGMYVEYMWDDVDAIGFHCYIYKGKGCISCLVFVLFRDYLCKVFGNGWMYDADFLFHIYIFIDRLILFLVVKHILG